MNEPVQVGITFPRSGQRLIVNVPSNSAAELNAACAGLQSKGVVRLRLGDDRPTETIEHFTRPL